MNPDDYAYFRRRAAQEDKAARNARCEEARICHRNLAAAYRASCARISMESVATAASAGASAPVAISTSSPAKRLASASGAARCQIQL